MSENSNDCKNKGLEIENTLKNKILELIKLQNRPNCKEFNQETEEEICNLLGIQPIGFEYIRQNMNPELYLEEISIFSLNNIISDLYTILNTTSSKKIIDIGAGNCFMAISNLLISSKKEVISIEPVSERMNDAIRICGNKKVAFIPSYFQDIDLKKIDHDSYFLYFPTGKTLEIILKRIHSNKKLIVIESHGDLIHRLDMCSRLISKTVLCKLRVPRHDQNCYEYTVTNVEVHSVCDQISASIFSDNLVLYSIEDKIGKWLATNKDAQIVYFKQSFNIQFSYPPRSVISTFDKLSIEFIEKSALNLKTKSILNLLLENYNCNGKYIRKIYYEISMVEFSDGSLEKY